MFCSQLIHTVMLLKIASLTLCVAAAVGVNVQIADGDSCASVTRRVDCGWTGISKDMCTSRGCCYSTMGTPECFYSTSGKEIKKVHIIMANHFDAGFTSSTTSVINKYFNDYFPTAAAVGELLSKNKTIGAPQMKWMTQSYLISLYLSCPKNMGLMCPTETEISIFKNAISKGWITYHAFPTNAELAAMNPEMIKAGFDLTHSIDLLLGVSNKTVLSQRDVPGVPRSSIRLLKSKGIATYSIGGNGRCNPPNVPQAFIWKDGSSIDNVTAPGSSAVSPTGEELLTFWHPYGYGQIDNGGLWNPENGFNGDGGTPESPRLELPNFDEALIYAWRGDNAGPITSPSDAQNVWNYAARFYPNAEIIASDLDTYSKAVHAAGDSVIKTLPVVTKDLSDSWIMGVQSDPWKEARARSFGRSLSKCLSDVNCPNDERLKNATRQAQKNGEHTWGLHVASMGKWHFNNWDNKVFHEGLASNDSILREFEQVWVEQRQYGIQRPMEALGDHPVKSMMEKEFSRLSPSKPSTVGFTPTQPNTIIDFGWIQFSVLSDGSLSNITVNKKSWPGTFGQLIYQSLNDDVYADWRSNYLRPGTGGTDEYGKPGVTPQISKNATYTSSNILISTNILKKELIIELLFPSNLHNDYGYANSTFLSYSFKTENVMNFSLQIFDKTSTRLPEALYLKFTPIYNNSFNYFMDKLGVWTNPIDVLDGSGKGLHGVTSGVAYSKSDEGIFIETVDSTLVRWGHGLYPFASPMNGDIPLKEGFAFCLHDNSWNTNYPFWWPFRDDVNSDAGGDMKWDFKIHF